MKTSTTTAIAFSFLSLAPASALAQEAAAEATTTRPAPEWRVDVGVPSAGIGAATDVPGDDALVGAIGAHATVAHRSGHGARIGVGYTWSDTFINLGSTDRTSYFVDTAYVHRFRLVGDDRLGLGLDLGGGVSFGGASDRGDSCWGGCGPSGRPDPERVANGAYLGVNAGASLDLRLSAFTMGLDVRGRAMGALERTSDQSSPTQAELITSLYLGFGFY